MCARPPVSFHSRSGPFSCRASSCCWRWSAPSAATGVHERFNMPPPCRRSIHLSRCVLEMGMSTPWGGTLGPSRTPRATRGRRSEEHTSELQSRGHLVCRLLLEKKKKKINNDKYHIYSTQQR